MFPTMFSIKNCPLQRTLLLLFVFVTPLLARDTSIADDPQCDRSANDGSHRYDPLACWLWNLQVEIPNQSFRESFLTIQIQDMHCTNFTMASIDSRYQPSSNTTSTFSNTNPAIHVAVSGISATCIGRYHVTGGIGGSVQAWVQQGDDQPHSVSLALDFCSTLYNDDIKMVSSVNATNCRASLKVNSLHFGGSISSRIINIFKSSIQGYVSEALSTSLCPVLQPELSNDLTSLIQKANGYIVPLLPKNNKNETMNVIMMNEPVEHDKRVSTTSMTRRQLSSSLRNDTTKSVNWKADTPVLYQSLHWMNRLLNQYLNKGLFVTAMDSLGWNIVSDKVDCGYFFRGINGLLRSLTRGHVDISVPKQVQNVSFVIPAYGKVSLQVQRIAVDGLDNFTSPVNLLHPFANQTFFSTLSTESNFNISIDMNAQATPMEDGMVQGDALQESFVLSVNSSRASVGATVAMDYNAQQFHNVHLQDVIHAIQNYQNISQWSCLLAPIQALNISNLMVNVVLSSFVFSPTDGSTGTLEKDIDAMLNSVLKLFLTEYSILVTESLTGLIGGPAQTALNDVIHTWISGQSPSLQHCTNMTSYNDTPKFVDFNDLPILRQWNDFLNRSLDTVNEYLACVANIFNKSMRPFQVESSNVQVDVTQLSIQTPGCIQQLEVLMPTNETTPFELKNGIGFGQCTNASGEPGLFSKVNVSSPLFDFDGTFNTSMWLGNVTLSGGSFLKYDLNQFRRLPLSMLLSDGLSAAMPIADLQLLPPAESIGSLGVNSSSLLQSNVFNSTLVTFSTENHETIPEAAQSILSWGLESIEELANGVIRGVLERMHNGTDVPPQPEPDAEWRRLLPPGAIAVAVFIILNVVLLCIRVCKSRASSSENELAQPLLPDDPYLEMEPGENHAEVDHSESTGTGGGLLLEKTVPAPLRHLFPIVIIGTVFLLLTSNVSVGTSVDLVIALDSGRRVTLPSLFAFSLGNTAREMYNAGIYSLLFLVVGFSGIWPYAKLLLMLFGWCAPTRLLSIRQRGRMVFLLDALGKFSLVDTFVLVLMMVSFRFHLAVENFMTVDVFVNPGFGFFGFLLATTVSLIAGHLILYVHRQSLSSGAPQHESKESLCRHGFEDEEYGSRRQMTKLFSGMIVLVMGLTVVFLAIGMTRKSFVFELGGLAGKLLGDDDRTKAYSVLTLGTSLPQSAENPSFGMTCLQTAFFFYAAIMPFSCLVALSLLFLMPMTLTYQRRTLYLAEIANAWSAVEVFALSIIISLLELSTFASFMIGHKCDLINEFLTDHFDDELGGDDMCYTVRSSVSSNVWFLVSGAVLNSITVSFLLKVAHRAITERIQRVEDEEDRVLLVRDKVATRDLVSMLLHLRLLGGLLFDVSDASEESLQHRRRKSRQGSKEFWQEWREVCSVT